jgi:predicted permease
MTDLRYAVRSLRRTPGFTVAAIMTLALGIGANTAIFTLLNGVLFKPLPVDRPEDLVFFHESNTGGESNLQGGTGPAARFAAPLFQRFQEAAGPSIPFAAFSRVASFPGRLGSGDTYEPLRVQLVSERFFETFAVRAQLGRVLTAIDNQRLDAHPVAVVSDTFWRRRFGGAPSAIGQRVVINNVSLTIVGVAASGFDGVWGDVRADVWVPRVMQHSLRYRQNVSASNSDIDRPWGPQIGIRWLTVVGRIAPTARASVDAAVGGAYRAVLLDLAAAESNPARREALLSRTIGTSSFATGFSGLRLQFAGALQVLMAMVASVLLIACVNVANLLLARGAARRFELATRLAMGASRTRLLAQMFSEYMLLAVAGGAAGVLAGYWLSTLVAAMLEQPPFALDARVFAFAGTVTVVTALVSGMLPALRATRLELAPTSGSRNSALEGSRSMRGMTPMLTVQIALSAVLVVSATLLGRTLVNLTKLDPGFDRQHLVSVPINARLSGYPDEQLDELYQRLEERLRATPGVESVALASGGLPFIGSSTNGLNSIEGYQPAPGEQMQIETRWVDAGYFSTVGMALREGREFDERDLIRRGPDGSPQRNADVVLVNEAAVRRFFGGQSPLRRHLSLGIGPMEIIGVVADARTNSLLRDAVPTVFLPFNARAVTAVLQARVTGDPTTMVPALRDAVAAAEPGLAIGAVETVEAAIDRNVLPQRLIASLATAFAALALLLACVGLYGVLSYSVIRRTAELGIRAAVGATPPRLLRMILKDGLRVIVVGLLLGVVGAAAFGRLLDSWLFGLTSSDPATYVAVLAALACVAMGACCLPAWRAARIDPVSALRIG